MRKFFLLIATVLTTGLLNGCVMVVRDTPPRTRVYTQTTQAYCHPYYGTVVVQERYNTYSARHLPARRYAPTRRYTPARPARRYIPVAPAAPRVQRTTRSYQPSRQQTSRTVRQAPSTSNRNSRSAVQRNQRKSDRKQTTKRIRNRR